MERYTIELYEDPGADRPHRTVYITVPKEYAKAIYDEIDALNIYNYLTAHKAGILDASITCAESTLATEDEFKEHLEKVEAICNRLIPKRKTEGRQEEAEEET